jgi:tRNA(fMet)-specific endonuclease VapC
MTFLFDTDHISLLQKQSGSKYAKLARRIAVVSRREIVFCIISFHEQVLGCNAYVAQAKTSAEVERGYRMFDRVLTAFAAASVLSFDALAIARFTTLVGMRLKIATMDLRSPQMRYATA